METNPIRSSRQARLKSARGQASRATPGSAIWSGRMMTVCPFWKTGIQLSAIRFSVMDTPLLFSVGARPAGAIGAQTRDKRPGAAMQKNLRVRNPTKMRRNSVEAASGSPLVIVHRCILPSAERAHRATYRTAARKRQQVFSYARQRPHTLRYFTTDVHHACPRTYPLGRVTALASDRTLVHPRHDGERNLRPYTSSYRSWFPIAPLLSSTGQTEQASRRQSGHDALTARISGVS